jgi:hypothetical protein
MVWLIEPAGLTLATWTTSPHPKLQLGQTFCSNFSFLFWGSIEV